MKQFFKNMIAWIGMAAFSFIVGFYYYKKTNDIQIMKDMIGEKVIIQKDTLMIIDYSAQDNTYTLSNGIQVNTKLIFKLKFVK